MNLKTFVKNNRLLYIAARWFQRFKGKYKFPIKGKNNKVRNKGVTFNVKYDIVGNNNLIEIMQGAQLSDIEIRIRGNNHRLIIRENGYFKGGGVWFEDDHCLIDIGKFTTIESAHLAVTEPNKKIVIGDDCMFSKEIEFRTGDSHSIIEKDTKKRINFAQDIVVGNHVWIGAYSKILKGISIGNNSIIGTNSIVTKSIPDNCIAAGIPASVLKTNVDWLRKRIYNKD